MKFQDIQEARYHKTPTRDDIYDKYRHLESNSLGDVQVLDVDKTIDGWIFVELRIWSDERQLKVIEKVKQFLKQHNLPYDDIDQFANLNPGDWRATIVLRGSNSPGVMEARYHKEHPVIAFIDDVERDEIRSASYPKDQWFDIIGAISRKWGEAKGQLGKDYIYWTGAADENYVNISFSHTDSRSVMVEVSKG